MGSWFTEKQTEHFGITIHKAAYVLPKFVADLLK